MTNKRILTLITLLLFLFLLVGCDWLTPNQPPEIKSAPVETATAGVDYTYNVVATDPDGDALDYSLDDEPTGMVINGTSGKITWTPTVAEIVTFTVVVTDEGGLFDDQNVTITVSVAPPAQLTSIVVLPETMSLLVGEEKTITSVTANYNDESTKDIVLEDCDYALLTTSDKKVVTVIDGVVKAVGSGTVRIVVSYTEDGITVKDGILITVNPVLLTSIVVSPKVMELIAGGDFSTDTDTITSVTAYYNDGSEDDTIDFADCTFVSDDETSAEVSDAGVVTAVAEGTATITVSYGGETDTLEVTVDAIELDHIVVDPKEMTLYLIDDTASESFKVTANYNDENTKVVTPECVYGIDDISIVTVANGTVTASKVGTATISISYTEGDITKETTLPVIVKGEITIRWLESAIRYNADGSEHSRWDPEPIPNVEVNDESIPATDPATLIPFYGGYYFDDPDEFFNYHMTENMELEGSIVISETGQLSGWATYTLYELLTKNDFAGQVEIIIYEEAAEYEGVPHDGTMVGYYTQLKYAFGTKGEVLEGEGIEDFSGYPGAFLAPDIGPNWWFVQYTDYFVHEWEWEQE